MNTNKVDTISKIPKSKGKLKAKEFPIIKMRRALTIYVSGLIDGIVK